MRGLASEVLRLQKQVDECSSVKELIDDENPFVRGLSICAVGDLKCKGVISRLRARLNDRESVFSNSEVTVGEYATIALGKLKHPAAIPYLWELVKKTKQSLPLEVTDVLCEFTSADVRKYLQPALQGLDSASRYKAVYVLARIESGIELGELLSKLDVEEFDDRTEAIENLSLIDPPWGLIVALENEATPFWDITDELRNCLSEVNKTAIVELLKSDYVWVRSALVEAIGRRRDLNWGQEIKGLVNDRNAFVRGLTIRALGSLKYENALPEIEARLSDEKPVFSDSDIRISDFAAIAASKLGSRQPNLVLINLLNK